MFGIYLVVVYIIVCPSLVAKVCKWKVIPKEKQEEPHTSSVCSESDGYALAVDLFGHSCRSGLQERVSRHGEKSTPSIWQSDVCCKSVPYELIYKILMLSVFNIRPFLGHLCFAAPLEFIAVRLTDRVEKVKIKCPVRRKQNATTHTNT